MQAKALVCSICAKHILDTSGDLSLGTVLIKLNTHISKRHPEKYAEYAQQRDIVISLVPAYLLIDWFVNEEKTRKINPDVADAIRKSQEVIGEALDRNIEVIEDVMDDKPTQEIVSKEGEESKDD